MSVIARLARMDRRELAFRTGVATRGWSQRLASSVRAPRWDWSRAQSILVRPFEERGRARRFPLDANHARTLPSVIARQFPDAPEDARRTAHAVLDGRLDILGYRDVAVGVPPDWHRDPVHRRSPPRAFWSTVNYLDPRLGDHKIIWEINRHQHWLALGRAAWLTGDRLFVRGILAQLDSWLDQNPPLTGVNWASMLELGLRCLSWLWALPFLLSEEDDRAWLPRMLVALDAQLEHVHHNLSHYFSPNTHLLGEALALYVAGLTLPELKHAPAWAEVGRRVLLEQIARQVHADGGHAELSAHYHRYALDFYLLALTVARLSGDADAAPRFEEVARRLARYARALADDTGRLPLIGDDDGGQLFPLLRRDPADATTSLAWAAALLEDGSLAVNAAPPEELFWLLGEEPSIGRRQSVPEPVSIDVFPDSGYGVARTSRGDHLVLDGGRHGFLNGGHAHADALACVLTLGRRPLLIDPGTSTYTMDLALRDRLRRSEAHNTARIDGRTQAMPSGPFHWSSMAHARLVASEQQPGGVWLAAAHDAYAPVLHRRDVFVGQDGVVIIVDAFSGDAELHTIDLRWTLDRAWDYQPARGGARLIHESGSEARVVSTVDVIGVRAGLDAGWCAPVYGQLLPTWTLVASVRSRLPIQIVTAFSDEAVPPTMAVDAGEGALTVRLEREGRVDELRLQRGRLTHARVASSVQGAD